jgi:hypothetical protein
VPRVRPTGVLGVTVIGGSRLASQGLISDRVGRCSRLVPLTRLTSLHFAEVADPRTVALTRRSRGLKGVKTPIRV